MFFCCCGDSRDPSSSSEILPPEEPTEQAPSPAGVVSPDDATTTATPPSHVDAAVPAPQAASTLPPSVQGAEQEQAPQRAPIKGGVFKPPPKPEDPPPVAPITLPKSDKARRTSVPVDADLGSGAYLVFDKDSNTLYTHWSMVPVEGALAWLRPLVQVPAHKFNVNKGKSVLTKDCANPEKYFQAWISFVKITREFPSKLMLLDNFAATEAPPVQFLILETPLENPGTTVCKRLTDYGKLYDLVKNVKAVAVVPPTSTLIPVDAQIDSKTFIQRGTGEGAATGLESLNA
ncbi:hypothetical protein CSUI_008078 [Cystoisospora suis]|uniref:Immune mapped protein 2 N-terminal domain-containing protein n=1 Tax=Cystoisospora suis TaxID=483139 RepID=A0A2C6KNA4_9APIC|nr:hypothetical protein CSUI_008078 [Cystoisospora suis]